MRVFARSFARLLSLLLLAAILLFALVHTPPVKNLASQRLLAALERSLGGSATLRSLDYRLWRGEIRAEGLSWTREGTRVSVRQVLVLLSLRGPLAVRVAEPDVQVDFSPGADGGDFALPAALLGAELEVAKGRMRLEWPEEMRVLELTEIEASLAPEGAFSRASLDAASGRFRNGNVEVGFGPALARLRLGPREVEIDEARLSKDGSFVTASGKLGPLSPLSAEIRFEHSLEGSLLAAFDPRIALEGPLEGEGAFRRRPGAEDEAEGSLSAQAVSVSELGPISLESSWRFAGDVASADVSFESLDSTRLPLLSSRVTGRVGLAVDDFDFDSLRGEGLVSLRAPLRGAPPGIPLRGDVALQVEAGEIRFSADDLTVPGARVAASGTIGASLEARVRARVDDLSAIAPLLASAGIPPPPAPLTGALAIEARVDGPLGEPSLDARIEGDAVGIGGLTFAVGGGARLRGARIEADELTLRSPEEGSIVVDGSIPTREGGGAFDLDVRVEDLPLAEISEALASGTITASFAVSGKFSQPVVRTSFTTRDLATKNGVHVEARGEAQSQGLAGAATLRLESTSFRGRSLPGTTLDLESDGDRALLSARLDGGLEILAAEVGLTAPYPLAAEIPLENLPFAAVRDVFPALVDAGMELEVSGRARVRVSLFELEDLRYRVDTERILAVYRGIALGATTPFVIEGTSTGFSVSDLTLVGEDTAVGIDGVVPLSRDGSVVLHLRGASRLELLRPWFPEFELAGRANADVHVEGALPDPWLRGDLSLEGASARFGDLRVENVEARADWSDRALVLESLSGETLGGRFRASGELPPQLLDRSAPVRLRFEASDLQPLTLVAPEESGVFEETELRVALEGDLGGAGTDLSRWQGQGNLREVRFGIRGMEIANEAPGSWRFENGALSISDFRMTRGETRLLLAGEVLPLERPLSYSARASGTIDHEITRIFLQDLGLAFTGVTELDLRAEKVGDEPMSLTGRGGFQNARLVVRNPPIAFTNVSGEIALSGSSVSLERLEADAGGGKVGAEGTLTLEGGRVGGLDLRARARSLRLNYPEGLRSEVNGDLRLRGDLDRLRLTGDLDLARSLLSRDISVESELLQSLSRVSARAAPSSFASKIDLDLRVRAAEAFRIDNNLARMEASVNLTAAGTVAAPELSGIAAVRPGGRFRFGGNEYRVETGRIVLRGYPSTPPELDITARTSVGQYDIRLVLRGSTDQLSTELTSESHPELSRGDVASLLITGRTLSEISSESRDVVSNRMVSYLGTTLADLAKLGIGEALPFEILTVEPSLIAGEADPGARFTIGARFNNSLSLVYSIGLDNAENQIWVVDYELPRRTRTQIVRDEDNEYTLGLSQEIRFDVRDRARADAPQPLISEVRVTVEDDPSGREARDLLPTKPGGPFDYWKIWERAEKARRELRSRGYLEAVVDVATAPAENGGVGVEYRVRVGPKVIFVFPDDEPEGSVKKTLENAWTGDANDSFLASDLAMLATGTLFEQGYFAATVEVATERTERELLVKVFLRRGPRGKRVSVDVVGNEAVSDSFLLASLPKPRSAAFHDLLTTKRSRLKQILALQYASQGFVAATIGDPETELDEGTGDYRVAIPVTEGRRFLLGPIELAGVAPEDQGEIRSRLSLREGEPFRVESFAQGRSAVSGFYRERGFPDVEVEASVLEPEAAAVLGLRFKVRPGPRVTVAEVEVRGNQVTRESVVRREIKLTPGAPLSASALRETEKGLYELGVFQSAEVVVEEPGESEPSRRAVRVAVVETPDLELDYGGRASTDGFFEVLTELRAPNLFGRAHHAGLRALVGSERKILRFSYHSPYLARYKLDTDFFVERSIEHLGTEPFDFTDRIWTFTTQQSRPIKEKITAQWSYTFRRIATEVGGDFGELTRNRGYLTGSLIGDERDNPLSPRRGSLWLITTQLAPELLGSDLKYTKILGQFFAYVPLGADVVWASGYRVGTANSFGQRLDQNDGFRAGGPNSVRGFEQDALGPADIVGRMGGGGLVVFNQEIRFPLWWRLRGVGFYDAGNAFETASDIRLSDLRQSLGAGLRLELPFGLIRLDWAAVVNPLPGEKPWRLLFSLGDAF